MKKFYVLKTFLTLCFSIAAVYVSFVFMNVFYEKDILQAFQFQTIVSSSMQSAHKHPILVQIHMIDNPSSQKILAASFDNQILPLKIADQSGERGTAHLQAAPGTYIIRWKVEGDRHSWPKTKEFYKTITIDKNNLWFRAEIRGDTLTVD